MSQPARGRPALPVPVGVRRRSPARLGLHTRRPRWGEMPSPKQGLERARQTNCALTVAIGVRRQRPAAIASISSIVGGCSAIGTHFRTHLSDRPFGTAHMLGIDHDHRCEAENPQGTGEPMLRLWSPADDPGECNQHQRDTSDYSADRHEHPTVIRRFQARLSTGSANSPVPIACRGEVETTKPSLPLRYKSGQADSRDGTCQAI